VAEVVPKRAQQAASAWWRSLLVQRAATGAAFGLVGATASALALELFGGLQPQNLAPLLAWTACVPVAAATARLPSPSTALAELDARAGLADRLGTAFEFASDDSPMAALQRADAEAHAGVAVGPLFRPAWGRLAGRLLPLLLLLLVVVGASLAWQLGAAPAPPAAPPAPEDDLLAAIDAERTDALELGDKEGVRLLNDLERRIRRIRRHSEELRQTLKRRPPPPPQEPDEPEEPEVAELPPPPPPEEDQGPRITAEDLERLEAATLDQLALTDAQSSQVAADLFRNTRKSREIMREFNKYKAQRNQATPEVPTADAKWGNYGDSPIGDYAANPAPNTDLLGDAALSSRLSEPENEIDNNIDAIRRDLGVDGQIQAETEHVMQLAFQNFLQEFVKDVQDLIAEEAVGKKRPGKKPPADKPGVKTNAGTAVADKSDAMKQAGFEEIGEQKRSQNPGAPPEEMVMAEGSPPPDSQMTIQDGPGDGPTMAGGPADGKTSAGASGAGKGQAGELSEGAEGSFAGTGTSAANRLERVLGQVGQGALPPEQRQALFDRIAQHKVQAGLASEADDVLVDYFAEATELMDENRDSLPWLFRDYAQSYFEAIRPGD
jgi:hypothetical protein